ncbi:MAG: bifunctional folylpolyglutamate synthase/dihydrofolate synthase [Rickettsiales bacterium]|nr:bifunctional folylpolyglutamate synthase/dihydrofolate synthase [Pseudomonadota bacterium]MDA0966905.1 bifunctional folylpolyglutamate synthase/dihydrofolate synthase [Pseudomonadota bacterium]MDG4544458.1 bifunctional folylpolyglutamate synthase/dihydrofolate synthase [Rickettsiales bacterium]MDG4546609.1 bifunctional folylpolyglutamate synthase/dihydrofolate synthase [Rickettsiales bacterium]MDG4548734.1 bifunctional folylpolyglutamate synthase/dihydrofolate synthase [Rickettsiales bacteri
MVFMPKWPQPLGSKPIDFGLERVLELLEKLGNPHKKLPPVIHYAGTNGKGSTIAFSRAILEAAGYKVHVYSSPHLLNFNERITLAGNDISEPMLEQIVDLCRIKAADMRITFFEGTTAMAYLAFSQVKADIVLLETGMGGRLDATNVIDKPACTVITPISLDHTEYLGPTIPIIAGEKAGIIKQGVPCISSLQFEDAHNVIEAKAEELNAPLFSFGYDWIAEKTESGMVYKSTEGDMKLPSPALIGDHQIVNAGAAIAALKQLKGFSISDTAYAEGLKKVKWPARMQQLTSGRLIDMLPQGWEIWLDGAHNNAGANVVSCMIDDWKNKPTYLVCGFTRGRNAQEMLSHFKGKVKFVCGMLVQTEIAAQTAHVIADAAKKVGIDAKDFDSIEDAISFLPTLDRTPARIIFCGSLYLASDAMKANKKC